MADATYTPKVYRKQGGDELVVASGGQITVESGGTIVVGTTDLIGELAALDGLDATELGYINGVTAGTVAASKAVVVDANKDAASLRNVTVTNLDAGASGTAGTVDVFPTTASKGKLAIACTDQTGNTTVTLNANAMGQATTVNIPDPGAAAGYVVMTTAALALAEADVLQGATAGTPVASKAQIADANQNIGAVKCTGLSIGTSGSETAVTASAEQLNSCDLSVGAAAGAGVVATELGFGYFKTTKLALTNTPVVLADEAGVVAYGGLKIYDFPQGYIYMQSAVADLAITKSSAGVNDDWDGDIGLGTVTASNNATLAATEQNIIPTTATPQAAAGATTGDGVSTATEHAILDGTSAAVDLFVNLLVDDADHDVTSTPCNLILNGTITVNWLFMGDN